MRTNFGITGEGRYKGDRMEREGGEMRPEIKQAAQMIINSYGGKYGEVRWDKCTNVEHFNVEHTDGFTCTWDGWYVICFRGSHGEADWHDNFTFQKCETLFPPGYQVNVHTGFMKQYDTVSSYLKQQVIKHMDNMQCKLLICGHSLGGALASLCAVDMQTFFLTTHDITCVTWGSPRVGGRAWARLFNNMVPDSLRYVYRNDIVCRVPTVWMNFCHVGNKIHLAPGGNWLKRIVGDKNDHYPQQYFKAMMEG